MTTPSPRSPRRKHKSSPDGSSGPRAPSLVGDDGEDVGYTPDDEGADLPPGRMHVVNQHLLRLQGKAGAGAGAGAAGSGGHHQQHTSSGSLSSLEGSGRSPIIMNSAIGPAGGSTGAICPPSPRSTRSRSPLTQPRGTGPERNIDYGVGVGGMSAGGNKQQGASEKNTNSTFDANSSISSLDDIVDQDILYDRAGLIDDLSQSSSSNAGGKNRLHNSREGFTNLTPVTERLSEETLEDVHAFSDLNPPVVGISISCRSQTSRANSQATDREGVLAALDECAEEDEESLEDPSESEQAHQEVILLTNMEKVDLNAGHSHALTGRSEDDGDFGGGEPGTTSLAGTDVGVVVGGGGGGGCGMGTAAAGATGESGSGDGDDAPPPAS
jgi:hypothetical protein